MEVNKVYSLLEIGKRKNLEDYIYPNDDLGSSNNRVFLVCDGVGGENKGEVASKIVAETLGNFLSNVKTDITTDDIKSGFDLVITKINDYTKLYPAAIKMTTTLTLAVINELNILLAWCGDSRLYYIRNNEIIWKSKDHSLVQNLIDTNEITKAEAETHPLRNVITRSISVETDFDKIDFYEEKNIGDNDYILLATDGFFEQINDDILINCLKEDIYDKEEYFKNICEGKTNDNYSFQLIKLKKTNNGI